MTGTVTEQRETISSGRNVAPGPQNGGHTGVTDRKTERHGMIEGQTEACTRDDKRQKEILHRQTDRQTDRQTGRQADRKTEGPYAR